MLKNCLFVLTVILLTIIVSITIGIFSGAVLFTTTMEPFAIGGGLISLFTALGACMYLDQK